MNGPATETQWYIARDGKQHGPLSDIEMRTFVAHNYLRPNDLIWRPGMSEWLPAPHVFPAVFPMPAPPPAPILPAALGTRSAPQAETMGVDQDGAGSLSDMADEDAAPRRSMGRKLMSAALALVLLGGGAMALVTYREPLLSLVSGKPETADDRPVAASEAATAASPAAEAASDTAATDQTPQPEGGAPNTSADSATTAPPDAQTAALTPPPAAPAPPVDGSDIDVRLQKIPVWTLLKRDYHDWYETTVGEAAKMEVEKRPESDVAMHLAQGLVALRRQNAEKALAASPERLREMASAFLANLQALQTQGVSACYGFISKGETSPAIVQLMQTPETASAFNGHVKAVFDAIAEGSNAPTEHAAAAKGDYDILIKELGKIGWKEEDLKTFSNPRLLAKQPPDQVCKMVIDWFVAHLAVKDEAVQERLLFETLKPVVTG